ncbi:MAG: hypothetical protein SVV80_02265 [Planctomycetota bacterium]|nr:hypothetical protein [Planctomycetota bacterium]
MKLWPDRKTDEEYVEQMRKNFKRRWPFARVWLLVSGLVVCGGFFCNIWMLSHAVNVPIGTIADRLLFSMAFVLGTMAGMMFSFSVGCFCWGVFWSWRQQRDIRLMLKYHDALVAHGISLDEVE